MAKIIKKTLSWMPSTSDDVAFHKVYVETGAVTPNYGSQSVEVQKPKSSLLIPDEFVGLPLVDGKYNFGISAVDDAGNESDISVVSANLDFLAPSAPTGLSIS